METIKHEKHHHADRLGAVREAIFEKNQTFAAAVEKSIQLSKQEDGSYKILGDCFNSDLTS